MQNFMMRYLQNKFRTFFGVFVVFVGFVVFGASGCSKVDNQFGNDLIPPSQAMGTRIDSSFLVSTSLFKLDSVLTSNVSSIVALGSYIDPLVGRTSSQVFANFTPGKFISKKKKPTDFGRDAVADSIFLNLEFSGLRGDSTAEMQIDVFRVVGHDFSRDSSYYSNFDMTPYLGGAEAVPLISFKYSGGVGSTQQALPMEFARELMEIGDDAVGRPYSNNDVFRKKFKGFYFRTTVAERGVPSKLMNVNLAGSFVRLYYHNFNTPDGDTTAMKYYFKSDAEGAATDNNVSFEMVKHDYGYADPAVGGVNLADIGSGQPVAICFTQGMAGLGTYVQMPKDQVVSLLSQVREQGYSTVALHKAELIFDIIEQSAINYDKSCTRLGLYYDFAKSSFIPDYDPIAEEQKVTNNFGGSLNRSLGVYRMDITSYFQRYITSVASEVSGAAGGEVTDRLQLLPYYAGNLIVSRSQMYGSAAGEGAARGRAPRMVLVYTMIK